MLAQAMALPGGPVALYATTRATRLRIAAAVLSSPPQPAMITALSTLMAQDRDAILKPGQPGGGFGP